MKGKVLFPELYMFYSYKRSRFWCSVVASEFLSNQIFLALIFFGRFRETF